eukprot:TRINITY_DN16968_c0_g1_i3.p2 TRINITY_DN16968_c0_g1~~TRINITY_DN16968_c0_g1_i3.p2  ORF type:complete len:158 (-),score=16.28 TRINITY_DN16968_c0_g1_i3:196-669(-)
MDFPDDWLDCSEVPCNRIHVWLSSGSFLFCAHAVLCSTLVVCWLSLTPVSATRDFYYTFPNAMRRPAQSMATGTICWAADNIWLAMVQHGTKDMQWVLIPMVFLFAHVVLLLVKMRAFARTWPNHKNAGLLSGCGGEEVQPLAPTSDISSRVLTPRD